MQCTLQTYACACIDAEPACRGGTQEQGIGPQEIEAILGGADQAGLHAGSAEGVDADDFQHVVAIGNPRIDLHNRTCDRDFRHACEPWIDAFVKAGTRAAHLKIGGAGEELHAIGALVPDERGLRNRRLAGSPLAQASSALGRIRVS